MGCLFRGALNLLNGRDAGLTSWSDLTLMFLTQQKMFETSEAKHCSLPTRLTLSDHKPSIGQWVVRLVNHLGWLQSFTSYNCSRDISFADGALHRWLPILDNMEKVFGHKKFPWCIRFLDLQSFLAGIEDSAGESHVVSSSRHTHTQWTIWHWSR